MLVKKDKNTKGISLEFTGRPANRKRDIYEYWHRVDGAVRLLKTCPLPFVVSVEGEWGRGKSTFLNMLTDSLSKEELFNGDIIKYNPWHYDIREFEDAWESLVETIVSELRNQNLSGKRLNSLIKSVGENRWFRLIWRVGIPSINLLAPGGGQIASGISKVLESTKKYMESPKRLGRRYAIFEHIRKELINLSLKRRVVLAIDDLDRCDPVGITHIMRCIPTLFAPQSVGPNFIILIGMDRKAVTEALCATNQWQTEYVEGYLNKVINTHITLPMLQIGAGNREIAKHNIHDAITMGGNREERSLLLPVQDGIKAKMNIPPDQAKAIAKLMHYNPRELEKFCILFDLKWDSRFETNSKAWAKEINKLPKSNEFQKWADKFRDRIIWESIVELRWPLYDSKVGDAETNKKLIISIIDGTDISELRDSLELPAYKFINDPDFVRIHKMYFKSDWN